MFLDYFALGLMIFALVTCFYLVIAIHDIPYEIAKHRNHPHLDAIHVAGWVSLLTLHVIWPFLWIWATMYREDRGYGFGGGNSGNNASSNASNNEALEKRLADMEAQIKQLSAASANKQEA